MKRLHLLFVFICIFSLETLCQHSRIRYLEVPARMDILGNMVMDPIRENVKQGADTMLDAKAINKLITSGRTTQRVINLLAAAGWQFLQVLPVEKKEGLSSNPEYLYYFKREE